MADKRKREIKPETREKLRQLAVERHKEGKFGGAQYGKMGGRPRKASREALDAVSEAATKNQDDIIQVFKDAVADNQPIAIRLRGAESWLNTQKDQAKLTMQEEEQDQKQFDRAQVIAMLSEKLTSGPAGYAIREQLEQPDVESTAIEIEENGDGPHV